MHVRSRILTSSTARGRWWRRSGCCRQCCRQCSERRGGIARAGCSAARGVAAVDRQRAAAAHCGDGAAARAIDCHRAPHGLGGGGTRLLALRGGARRRCYLRWGVVLGGGGGAMMAARDGHRDTVAPFPLTMEELHLHVIAVDASAVDATARFGRECAAYLHANGWTIRAATDSVGGLRLPRDSTAHVETSHSVPDTSVFLQPSAQLCILPQKREKFDELLEYVRSQGPALGPSGVAVFAHPYHAPAPPLTPAERHWLDFYLRKSGHRHSTVRLPRALVTERVSLRNGGQVTKRNGWSGRAGSPTLRSHA